MCKTKGSENTFQSGKLYYLKAIIPWLEKKKTKKMKIPVNWSNGKHLRQLARELKIEPDWISPKGRDAKFGAAKLYQFGKALLERLGDTTQFQLELSDVATDIQPPMVLSRSFIEDLEIKMPDPTIIKSGVPTYIQALEEARSHIDDAISALGGKIQSSVPDLNNMENGDRFRIGDCECMCMDSELGIFRRLGPYGRKDT